jgi:hypothetical protein
MKHLPLPALLLFCLPAAFAFAGQPEAVSLGKDGSAHITLVQEKADASLQVAVNSEPQQTFPHLGQNFRKLNFKGEARSFVAIDLNHDGTEALLLRSTQPPVVGSLWVFRWDKEKKIFGIVRAENGDEYLPVPLDSQVDIAADGELSFSLPGKAKKIAYRWTTSGYRRK